MIIDNIADTTGIVEITHSPYNYYLSMIKFYNNNNINGGPTDYLNISLFLSRKNMARRAKGTNMRGYNIYHYTEYFKNYNAPDKSLKPEVIIYGSTFFSNDTFEKLYNMHQNDSYFCYGYDSNSDWNSNNPGYGIHLHYNGITRQKSVTDKYKLCYFGDYLEMKDLKLFYGKSWFNDTIIDTFFKCISFHSYHFSEVRMKQNLPNEAITILSVVTVFWDKLLYGSRGSTARYNYKNGRSYLLQNIFDFKIIYLPANVNKNHWILIVIDVEKRKIFGFDSLQKHGTKDNMVHKYCDFIKQFILDDLNHKIDYTDIQKETTNEWHIDHNYLPNNQQNNGYDCGVFVCLNAVFCSKYKPEVGYERYKNLFDSQSITKFRKIMLYFFLTYFETY
jgi:hypothetical protein